jgi:hypothetical protein
VPSRNGFCHVHADALERVRRSLGLKIRAQEQQRPTAKDQPVTRRYGHASAQT